jgi:adenylate cyclase
LSITREELVERAGVPDPFIDRLSGCGLIRDEPPYATGDIFRARFLNNLDRGGLLVEAIGKAVRNGDFSFDFLDEAYWERFGNSTGKTLADLSAETGVSFEMLAAIRESLGFATPSPEDVVREQELGLANLVKITMMAGVGHAAMERHMRVWGENIRRIAEADANFYHAQFELPLLKAGMTPGQMMSTASASAQAFAPLLDEALLGFYHAQQEHTWLGNVIMAVEATLEASGLHRRDAESRAMCFLDLTGYTRLTEEHGDEAAADLARSLTHHVYRSASRNGGRPVKWLGDGVMIYFEHPGPGVAAALEMVEEIPAAGLPPAHVGIETGPIVMQDGDYFGRTVNIAARIAGRAAAGEVLVSDAVVGLTSEPGIGFEAVGDVELKGIAEPMRLHRAHRV